MYCKTCGAEINDEAIVCPKCGCQTGAKKLVSSGEDTPSTGMNALSFFIPLVGWILYFVWKQDTPIKAKSVAKWAWIGFAVNMVISLIYGIILGATVGSYYY